MTCELRPTQAKQETRGVELLGCSKVFATRFLAVEFPLTLEDPRNTERVEQKDFRQQDIVPECISGIHICQPSLVISAVWADAYGTILGLRTPCLQTSWHFWICTELFTDKIEDINTTWLSQESSQQHHSPQNSVDVHIMHQSRAEDIALHDQSMTIVSVKWAFTWFFTVYNPTRNRIRAHDSACGEE